MILPDDPQGLLASKQSAESVAARSTSTATGRIAQLKLQSNFRIIVLEITYAEADLLSLVL